MSEFRTATIDPALAARVVARVPLRYASGADQALDQPDHVRAGSSLAWIAGGIAVVQDDTNFIALFDPQGRRTRAIALPVGEGGVRQFDDVRGNKRFKLDLEACVATETDEGTLLTAFGSGSTERREYAVLVAGWERREPEVTLVHVPRLYAALRAESAFAGSELNVEGAAHVGEQLRLFARGNGATRDGLAPANATCDLHWPTLLAHLRAPDATDPPRPTNVLRYALGVLDGIAMTFTDAASWDDHVLFSAAAEDSPDATRDGRVTGSAIGVIDADGRTRWAVLTDPSDALFEAKVEGLLVDPADDRRLFIVTDADDPEAASELCTVELHGPWRG
jgi:hypothetical protein